MRTNINALPPHRFDISIIIPVEFHRGQTVDCVRGWTQEQDYPTDTYQIVLCAPDTLSPEIESRIRLMLRPWDLLEKRSLDHDMSLVAEAAHLAESDILLFTESHCIPEPNALSSLLTVAHTHPEWSGFSCQTTPITHNLLSKIEADVYASHIHNELNSSKGIKVMDQCFLVHRSAYFEAGGFRPEYRHFAEWLLAAEMYRRGLVIGHSAIRVIRHYYIGEMNELESFTLDFAIGQIRYLAECRNESTHTYFPEIPELKEYLQRNQADFFSLARLKTLVLPSFFFNFLKKKIKKQPCTPLLVLLMDWLETVARPFGLTYIERLASWNTMLSRRKLFHAIRVGEYEHIHTAFIDWFAKLVYLGRLRYLQDNPALQGNLSRDPNYSISGKLDFNSPKKIKSNAEWLGFFDREMLSEECYFRWSKPTASVWLPLHEGSYRIIIEWMGTRPLLSSELLHVCFDGKLMPRNTLQISASSLILNITVQTKEWHRLDWSVTPFSAKGDGRILGLPIETVCWFTTNQFISREHDSFPVNSHIPPVYFLHVPKCAGTSLSLIMENAYHSGTILSPYLGRYGPDDLRGIEQEPLYAYYRGHFRWTLPSVLHSHDWKVVTILRNPVDRIISLFYYFQQHGLVSPEKEFSEWFENDLMLGDTMTIHFLAMIGVGNSAGADSVQNESMLFLENAQENLNKCLAVGVMDNIEDSVNILSWKLGFLPPELLPRNNLTLRRSSVSEISTSTRSRIEEILATDMHLYKQAQKIFNHQLSEMYKAVSSHIQGTPNTLTVRNYLRESHLSKMAKEGNAASGKSIIDWNPNNIFHGDNLHPRELHGGKCLRWTGPKEATIFYFYIGTPDSCAISIRLHPATPKRHVELCSLEVNGVSVPSTFSYMESGETIIFAKLDYNILMHSQNGIACFSLTTPIAQGTEEFRMLGVAITGITIDKITNT